MKAITIGLAGLVGTAMADMDKMIKTLAKAARRNESMRALGNDWAADAMAKIDGYGCWCYLDYASTKGRGRPANEVDNACKLLNDGYQCAIMDGEDENKPCEPWSVDYTAAAVGDIATIQNSCNRNNRKGRDALCKRRACMVETLFVSSIFTFLLSGDVVLQHETYNHQFGFDVQAECPISGDQPSTKQCCGTYPLRYPFKELDGARKCCGEKTYNSMNSQCCPGEVVKAVC